MRRRKSAEARERRAVVSQEGSYAEVQTELPRSRAVIRAELRELAELHLAADLDWFKARFPNVWRTKPEQLEFAMVTGSLR
jgi:hypothetical protein